MSQKTIYIPSDKEHIWERAKLELGGSMSSVIVACLTEKLTENANQKERNEEVKSKAVAAGLSLSELESAFGTSRRDAARQRNV